MKRLIFLLLVFNVTACSSLRVYVPNPRVEVPELRGDKGFKITGALVGAHEYKSAEDASNRPPDLTRPKTTTAVDAFAGGLYSPIPRLEFGLELSPLHLGAGMIAKYQVLGEGSRVVDYGNIPLMVYARVGRGQGENSGDQNGVFGPGGYNWQGTLTETHLQAGLSAGFRTSPAALLYAGVAGGRLWTHTKITQDPHGGDPGGTYNHGSSGNALSGGGGVLFNWPGVQFYVGGEVTHVDYDQTRGMQDVYLHTGFFVTP
jgi:hypothetical protein